MEDDAGQDPPGTGTPTPASLNPQAQAYHAVGSEAAHREDTGAELDDETTASYPVARVIKTSDPAHPRCVYTKYHKTI